MFQHVYEVIYNRFGNDLILWTPEIIRAKEFLYDQPAPNPLEDPDKGFSACYTKLNPGLCVPLNLK